MLQRLPRRPSNELVGLLPHLVADAVHRLGHVVRTVPSHIFPEGTAEDVASRFPSPPRQAFGLLEDLVGNGDRGFHTNSITTGQAGLKSGTRGPGPLD